MTGQPLDAFDYDERAGVIAVWFWPHVEGVGPAGFALEMLGGPKQYARIFIAELPGAIDWGWRVRADAVLVWSDADREAPTEPADPERCEGCGQVGCSVPQAHAKIALTMSTSELAEWRSAH